MRNWNLLKGNENDLLPESKDGCVIVEFENGSIETVHIQDYFDSLSAGISESGERLYSKMYLNHNPRFVAWMELPEKSGHVLPQQSNGQPSPDSDGNVN